MSDSLSASEFAESLTDLSTIKPASDALVIRGLAKAPEDESQASQHVLVDVAGDCRHWIPFPLSLIGQVQILGSVTCRDHSHPLVAITLATPASPEAAALARIACAPARFGRQLNPFRNGRTGLGRPSTRLPIEGRTHADAIPGECATHFGHAAHSFLAAFEAAAAGDQEGAAAWADQFQAEYAAYKGCVALSATLP